MKRHAVLLALVGLAALPAALGQGMFVSRPQSCLGSGTLVAPPDRQLDFTQVYAQLDQGQTYPGELAHGYAYNTGPTLRDSDGAVLTGEGDVLRLVFVGTTVTEAQGYSNDTDFVSTVVQDSQVLTFPVSTNTSALCSSIRTAEGNQGTTSSGTTTVTDTGCPYSGDIALGLSIPLSNSYALTTLSTQLVVLDPSDDALHLACYDVSFTPYYPSHWVYSLIRYALIGMLAIYLILYLLARAWASYTSWLHDNETHLASSLTLKLSATSTPLSRRKMWGAVWFGAWAGKQVVGSGSLRRFVTAEFRELFAMVMWCSLVGTVAVQWPAFAYPVFAQTAWTTLIYNNSLPFTSPAAPLLPDNFTAPSLFASQMEDLNSPIYLDSALPNVLIDLESSAPGIERWARAVGVRKEDLWSVCAFTFFALCAAVIVAHSLFSLVDTALDCIFPSRYSKARVRAQRKSTGEGNDESFPPMKEGGRSSTGSAAGRRNSDGSMSRFMGEEGEEAYMQDGEAYGQARPEDDFPSWRLHLALLQGNLTRILFLFHLPLSIFTIYELSNYSRTPTSTFALAVVTLALVCLGAPAYMMWELHRRPRRELYTSLPLLLSLGPLYNTMSDECVLFAGVRFVSNLIVAVVLGAVQSTGTAQAAVILLVEVADTLITSLWLPWGDNAAMGPLAFVLCLSRIIIAVLLIVISPTVSVSGPAASWIAYIILLIQGLVILLLLFIFAFKFFELIIRVLGDVPFDESRSPRVGGLGGALRKWDRGGRGKNRRAGGRSGRGGGPAGAPAARRHDLDDLRRRGGVSETTIGTHTGLLDRRPGGQQSQASSLSYADTGASGYRSHYQPNQVEDEGFIMSAMSSGPWTSSTPGYVKPGAYSTGGPIMRSGPTWGEATVVPAASASTGFARVGGGRASSSNPYQLANASSPDTPTAYPPYPASSADRYHTGPPSPPPSNPRRLSQSAIIEMASATPEAFSPATRHPTRPSLSHPPSSSALLSNTVSHYTPDISPAASAGNKNQTGFFGRFRKNKPPGSDISSDDSDDEDERPKKKWGGLRLPGRRSGGGEEEETEEVVPPEERGFVVKRKQMPRPRPPAATSPAKATGTAPDGGVMASSSAPHVSVEAPSPPSSPREAAWRE